MENEIQSHEPQLLSVTAVGEELVRQNHFGAKSIQDRLDSTLGMWQHLLDLTAFRRKRLEEAVDFHQVQFFHKKSLESITFNLQSNQSLSSRLSFPLIAVILSLEKKIFLDDYDFKSFV